MKLRAGLVVVAASLLATSANAMTRGQWLGGISGGLHVPTGVYSDGSKTGFGLAGQVDYMVAPSGAVGADFNFNRSGASDDLKAALILATGGVFDDAHFTILHYGAHGKIFLTPERTTRPFITGGAGLYNFKATVSGSGVESSDSVNKFGLNGGVGIMFDTSPRTHISVQGLFHNIFTEGSSTNYMNGGVAFMFDLNRI